MKHLDIFTEYDIVYFVSLFVVLLALEVTYIAIAKRLKIGAPVTDRSAPAHRSFTTTGGGIIFIIGAIAFAAIYHEELPPHMVSIFWGAVILAFISFIDDLKNVPPGIRLFIQAIVIGATYWWLEPMHTIYLLLLIFGIGFVNAYNFMDGVNGMLADYTIVLLTAILYISLNSPQAGYPEDMLTITLLIATIVFALFNCRKTAKVFSGDVGAIVMGYFILYLLTKLILWNLTASYIVLVLVYGVDTVLTIIGRLFNYENILKSHKSHLYQKLTIELHLPGRAVSLGYAGLQALIDIGYFLTPRDWEWPYTICVSACLVAVYFVAKEKIRRYSKKQHNFTSF